jgi:enoyl-CoA hydratase/carnithine racemase
VSELVLAEDREAVRVLTLNRPDELNALSSAMVERLAGRLADAAGDAAVRVVAAGAPAGRSAPGTTSMRKGQSWRRRRWRLLQIAAVDPTVLCLAKRAVNRAWEAAGFRDALRAGVELGAEIESARAPERAEFDRIAAERGLKAPLVWRDSPLRLSV